MALTQGFATHCGWLQFSVLVEYLQDCCGKDDPQDGPIITYTCQQLDPFGCSDSQFDTNISSGGAGGTPSSGYPRVLPGIRAYNAISTMRGGLSFTLSAYGRMLPIVFGSDKLDGNVIWASPSKDSFLAAGDELLSYKTLSFALALCEGVINGVIRMWIDGVLVLDNSANVNLDGTIKPNADGFVLGATIDLTDPDSPLQSLDPTQRQTNITVFNGAETQVPEGIIVDVEGPENTPAYRGVAYVLFENWVTADNRIPSIEVEVSANVTNLWPRLYTDMVDTKFNTVERSVLHYDPFFDRVMINGRHTGTGDEGLVIFDGNSLKESTQQVYPDSNQWDNFGTTLAGFAFVTHSTGNQGTLRILNPFTGGVAASLGPGGGITGHSMTTGFGVMQPSSIAFSAFDTKGLLIDVFAGISLTSKSIGLATIGKTGQITMQYVANDLLPAINTVCRPIIIDDAHAVLQPTFSDGFASRGIHIFGISTATNEGTSLKPWRLTIDGGGAKLATPLYAAYPVIPVEQFGGTGFSHQVRQMLVDADGTLVFFVSPAAASGRQTRIVKWSPFTGAVVWSTAVSPLPVSIQSDLGGVWGILTGDKYAWIDTNGQILQVDLKTGIVKTALASLGDQQLPSRIDSHQFYNAYEHSILYFSAIAGQKLVKVFVDRLTRSSALVSGIVENLTARAGLKEADLEVSDLSVLTVQGYTIKDQKEIRACFQELQQAFTFDVFESDGKIKYNARGSTTTTFIPHAHLGGGDNGEWLKAVETNDGARNRKINLTYRDIEREYADNVQSVILDKTGPHVIDSQAPIDVTVPIVLTASEAKRLAEILLYAKQVNKTAFEFTLPARYQHLDPGDIVSIQMPDLSTTVIRLRKTSRGEDASVLCTGSLEDPDIYNDQVTLFGNVGRFIADAFPAPMPRVDAVAIPVGGFQDSDFSAVSQSYRLYLAFLNYRPITDDLQPFKLNLLTPGAPAESYLLDAPIDFPTWGFVVDPPIVTTATFSTDLTSVLRVKLVNKTGATMGPAPLGLTSLISSSMCNLCLVGKQLFQFANAVDEGNDTWRLTVLHRGLFNTNVADNPTGGDKFVLLAGPNAILDGRGIKVVDLPLAGSPRKAFQIFINSTNPFQPTEAQIELMRNLQPWSVAGLDIVFGGGDAVVSWKRRTRYGGEWPDDGSETPPLNETEERYTLWLFKDFANFNPSASTGYMRKVEVTSPTFTYTAAMQTADGFVDATDVLRAMVSQHGSTGQDMGPGVIRSV